MRLTTRTESIYTVLDERTKAEWAVAVDATFPFRLSLDPLTDMERGTQGIFIVPLTNEYHVDNSNRGRSPQGTKVLNLSAGPRIAVVISRPFATKDSTGIDVSSWTEVKAILNFREQVDKYIVQNVDDIIAMDAEPPLETTFDKRWYMSITEILFDEIQC